MRQRIFDTIHKLGSIIYYCLNPFLKKCYTIKYFFYSGWIAAQLKKVGKDLLIIYPVYIVGGENVTVGRDFRAGPRLRIETFTKFKDQTFAPSIIIGDNVRFGWDCHIGCTNKVIIGNNVLLASRVYISDHSHGDTGAKSLELLPLNRDLTSKGPIVIDDDVWIGEGVAILPGVHIGKGAVIGANAVVTKDVPEYCVAAGIPAKIIKRKFEVV